MTAFVYRAADTTGRVVEGMLEGASEAVALQALERQSLTPLTLRPAKNKRAAALGRAETTSIRLKMHELLEFTRQLRVMLKSGIDLLTALGILRSTAVSARYQQLLDRVALEIQRGATLSEALAAHPKTFDAFFLGTIRAGEAAGVHPEAMAELCRHYERRAALRREVLNALTYPAIVVVALVGACIVMLTWVVPQFRGLFAGMGADLPLPTRILMGISDVFTNHGTLLGAGVATLIVGLIVALRVSRTREILARIIARLPLFGRIVYLSTVIQFSRMIALLERAGLPLLETFRIVETALIPGRVQTLTRDVRRKVAGGTSIAASIQGTEVLPKLVEHMIAVGEATGEIDDMLTAAAEHLEEELRVRVRRLTVALEPVLVLVVSAMILFVALSIFLPIWEMNSLLVNS